MSLLLAKQKASKGIIDAATGEATIVRDALLSTFDLDKEAFSIRLDDERCEYPTPNGIKSLVKLLEDKYQAPVIITNGAKQGLSAAFFACIKLGITTYNMRTPYWSMFLPLADHHGLKFVETEYGMHLLVMPSNPDGFTLDYNYIQYLTQYHKSLGIAVIHDAVYFSHTYLPTDYKLGPLGDVQIYSLSKLTGLAGLRIGYVVCHNPKFYDHIINYQEMSTVGVSTFSQGFAYELFREME
jgi:aspartate/methionine/tyrosine aminotransferase